VARAEFRAPAENGPPTGYMGTYPGDGARRAMTEGGAIESDAARLDYAGAR
jgi:hypothetical protein